MACSVMYLLFLNVSKAFIFPHAKPGKFAIASNPLRENCDSFDVILGKACTDQNTVLSRDYRTASSGQQKHGIQVHQCISSTSGIKLHTHKHFCCACPRLCEALLASDQSKSIVLSGTWTWNRVLHSFGAVSHTASGWW
jgi:hypothetical protein